MKKHSALVSPVRVKPNFKGIAIPFKSPFDKAAAYKLFERHNGTEITEIVQWPSNECSEEQFAKWRDQSIYPIDIGDRKYHKAGVTSASEFVVQHFAIERTKGVTRLLDLLAMNNRKGTLKQGPYAVPKMMRDFYELLDDSEFHLAIITNAAHVVECFVRVEDGELVRTEDSFTDTFGDLIEQFKACGYAPMSLGRYLRDQWTLGIEVDDIVSNISFWTRNQFSVEKEIAGGIKAFEQYPRDGEFMAGGKKGIVLKTDDRFLVKAAVASGEYAYRVIVDSKGHVVVTTHRIDLSAIAQKLQEHEPKLWYYQGEMFSLINGGPQYVDTSPTKLSYVVIVDMIQEAFGRPVYKHMRHK